VHAFAAGEPLRLRFKICFRVDDALVGACIACELRFVVRARGADHARADPLRHLDQQKPDTTRGRVHQRRFSRLQLVSAVQKIMRRHAL
jgi:hypothetical protein